MAWSIWSGRFGSLKRRRLNDDDFQEEIRAHLAIATDERVAAGAERHAAHQAALKDFGNVALTTEAARLVWTTWWIEVLRDWLDDVRHAIRVLARTPSFSFTVVTVLALGIGLNAAVFTLLKSLALSPIAGVDRSASLFVVLNETRAGRRAALSYPDYRYLRDHDRAFTGLVGSANTNVNLGSGDRAERVFGELVTGNYFQALGVRAELGRTLLPSDEVAPGQHPVVVLSDSLWTRHFGSDPDIVGKTVRLNAYPMTVVGVAAPSFHGTIVSFDVEVFIPVMMAPQVRPGGSGLRDPRTVLSDTQANFLIVQGRLRPGTTRADASAQMALLSTQLRSDAAIDAIAQELKVIPIWQSPFGAQTYLLPAVMVLSAMGGLLLLIVCANVAGLVLARGVSRRGEIALRLALGASRTRIVRLLLVESIVLAVPGAVIALALVREVLEMVGSAAMTAAPLRLFFNLSVDPLVVGFCLVAALGSALVFGLFPALHSSGVDLLSVMKDDLSPRSADKGRLRSGLVVSQVAVSLVLLIGAGLVTRSVDSARHADMGFDATEVASVRLELQSNRYDETRGRAFFTQLLENVRADTGIESATLAISAPLTIVDSGARKVTIDGYDPHRDEDLTFLSNVVAPDYFRTLRIGLLAGREFESRDDESAMPAVIVNETLARRFWGGAATAIGKRLRVVAGEWRTVIGVVRDIKYSRITEGPRPYVYLPFLQTSQASAWLHVRGAVGVATLIHGMSAKIQALDPELPILSAGSLSEQTRWSFGILEMTARVLFIIGVAGMALAVMGIYGLVSYTVKQSTHEIGIRIALGASRGEVVWHFLRRGLRLGAIGVVVGTIAALASTRLLGSVLFGVGATDPVSFATALAVVLGAVLVATLVPAWQAARTSPLAALRQT